MKVLESRGTFYRTRKSLAVRKQDETRKASSLFLTVYLEPKLPQNIEHECREPQVPVLSQLRGN